MGIEDKIEVKVDVTPIITGLIQMAFNLWETKNQASGKEEIPSWEEITNKNALLQAKIDAEK